MTTSPEQLWFTRRAGQIRGPYPLEQIHRYILLGRLRDTDELSRDRMSWRGVHQCPECLPPVMRELETAADQRRLEAARRRADERRGGDRRTQRMSPEHVERRRGERRRTSPVPRAEGRPALPRQPAARLSLAAGLTLAAVVALVLGLA